MQLADSWTKWCIVWKKWTGAGYVSASETTRRNETLELNENLHGEGFISSNLYMYVYSYFHLAHSLLVWPSP